MVNERKVAKTATRAYRRVFDSLNYGCDSRVKCWGWQNFGAHKLNVADIMVLTISTIFVKLGIKYKYFYTKRYTETNNNDRTRTSTSHTFIYNLTHICLWHTQHTQSMVCVENSRHCLHTRRRHA